MQRVAGLLRRGWGRWRDALGPDYTVARQGMVRGAGLIFLMAFWSLAAQAPGLWGARGLSPVGALEPWLLPAMGAGGLAGALMLLGVLPWWSTLTALGLWIFALQLPGNWLGLPGDRLLAEFGVVLLLLSRPRDRRLPEIGAGSVPPVGIFLANVLLFRVLLGSGLSKLLESDPFWLRETALHVFFETQPLPSVPAWYLHHLPATFLKYGVWAVMMVELMLPFYFFLPRLFRALAAGGTALLMLGVIAIGNHGPAPWVVLLLAAGLVDDRFLRERLPARWAPPVSPAAARKSVGWVTLGVLFFWVPLNVLALRPLQPSAWLPPWAGMGDSLQRLGLLHHARFGSPVRPRRLEVEIQGSLNGEEWREYLFKYKPGHPQRLPRFAGMHVPRLDLAMAGLADQFGQPGMQEAHPWLEPLLNGLLRNDPQVLSLLAVNPFPDQPPRHLRLVVYQVRFADPVTRRERGIWWLRAPRGSLQFQTS